MPLAVSLLLGQIADDRNLESFAVEGFDQADDPEDKQSKHHQRPENPCEPADERYHPEHNEPDFNDKPGNGQKDGLPGVEADVGVLVERRAP